VLRHEEHRIWIRVAEAAELHVGKPHPRTAGAPPTRRPRCERRVYLSFRR
jgi:hypothetical protein